MTDTTVQPSATPAPAVDNELPVEAKKVEAKDLVVFVTFLSSALALVYDSGFFWGLDLAYFTFFTLAEHLLFALEAIPITLMAVALALLLHGRITSSHLLEKQRLAEGVVDARPMPEWWRRVLMAVIFVIFFGIAYGGFRERQFAGALVFAMAPVITYLAIYSPAFAQRVVWVPSISFCLILFTFVYGVEIGGSYATTTWVTHSISLKTDSGCLTARIVRSGAAGVLFIDQPTKQVSFIRWDDIKRISAHREGEPPKCPPPTTPPAAPSAT
jgi:hypothetical protein